MHIVCIGGNFTCKHFYFSWTCAHKERTIQHLRALQYSVVISLMKLYGIYNK